METKEEIFATLKSLLVENFELDESKIIPQAMLYEDLSIDSIDAIDLLAELRDITGKKIDPETFKRIRTVEDVVETLHHLLNEAVAA